MYTKHDWQDGELITKTLMNNMEAGIEDANNRAMTPGPAGADGANGADGKSAFDIWKEQEGNADKTETDFLNSLKVRRAKKAIQESRALPARMAQLVLKVIQVQKLHLSRLMLTVQQLPAQHI